MTVSVVTGANKGVGFGIVRALCKKVGGTVILTARNEERGLAAVKALQAEGLNPAFEKLDVCSDKSVTKFREIIKSEYGGIDILCNNAGIKYGKASSASLSEMAGETEIINSTNLLATINVTNSLLPLMKDNGRICQIAGMVGTLNYSLVRGKKNPIRQRLLEPTLTVDGLMDIYKEYIEAMKQEDYTHFKPDCAYPMSKCLLVAHTRILGREIENNSRNLLLNCCCPGWTATDMTAYEGPLTIDEGAVTPLMVCTLPLEAGSGKFYREQKVFDWERNRFMAS